MSGLSHYGSQEYHLEEHQYSDYTERIKGLLESNKRETKSQSQKVYQALSSIIQQIPIDEKTSQTFQVKNHIGIDLTLNSVEVLETGSSARGTNVPYDYDFDYIFRLNSSLINDAEKMQVFRTNKYVKVDTLQSYTNRRLSRCSSNSTRIRNNRVRYYLYSKE